MQDTVMFVSCNCNHQGASEEEKAMGERVAALVSPERELQVSVAVTILCWRKKDQRCSDL